MSLKFETFQNHTSLRMHDMRVAHPKIPKDQSTMWPPMLDLGIRGLNMNFPEARIQCAASVGEDGRLAGFDMFGSIRIRTQRTPKVTPLQKLSGSRPCRILIMAE